MPSKTSIAPSFKPSLAPCSLPFLKAAIFSLSPPYNFSKSTPSANNCAVFLTCSSVLPINAPEIALFSTTTHSIAKWADKNIFSLYIQPVSITLLKCILTQRTDFPDVRFFILPHFIKLPTAKEETAKSRRYSVGYLPNRGKPSPQLIISGKWLKELGFEVGSHYTLTRQAGQLIIRLAKGE